MVLQVPDPNHAMDTVLFSMLYVVWPMLVAVAMFLFVLKISFAPPDDQDVERLAPPPSAGNHTAKTTPQVLPCWQTACQI